MNLDGRPVDRAVLRRMLDAVRHRGPDKEGIWVDGPVGLGQRALWTVPEQLEEQQPLLDESGRYRLVMDGRVDNRGELGVALEGRGVILRDRTDAEVCLKAFITWGDDAPERILGDFALALWDAQERMLWAARDVVSVRPFHYWHSSSLFAFGSEMHQVLHVPGVERRVNEGMVAEHLTETFCSQSETLFAGVLRLPGAHLLKLDWRGVRVQRYWTPDFRAGLETRDGQDCAEEFREILRKAVRCRLRSTRPVAVELSGGLDSTSVLSTACELNRAAGDHGGISPYSVTYPGLPCDESDYIRDTATFLGVNPRLVPFAPFPFEGYRRTAETHQSTPGYPNGIGMTYRLWEAEKDDGCRVFLTGLGGNQRMEGDPGYLGALAGPLRWTNLARALAEEVELTGMSPSRLVLHHVILPNMPAAPRGFLLGLRRFLWRGSRFPPITDQLARDSCLADRVRTENALISIAPLEKRWMADVLLGGGDQRWTEAQDRECGLYGLEARHPFHDRRMIEFGLRLPSELKRRDGLVKFTLRTAMKGRLPESVLSRKSQPDFDAPFWRGINELAARFDLTSSCYTSYNWLSNETLRGLVGCGFNVDRVKERGLRVGMFQIWQILALDLWWRTSVRQPRSALALGA